MAEEKTVHDQECKALQVKVDWLEKLCRALQTERNELSEKVEGLKGGSPAELRCCTPGTPAELEPAPAIQSVD